MRRVVHGLILTLVVLGASELISAYTLFQTNYNDHFALRHVLRKAKHAAINIMERRSATLELRNSEKNPFVNYSPWRGWKFHPFIDYSGAFNEFDTTSDYFGFRNKSDLYFEKQRDYILICFTGGSEAAGHRHRVTIAQNLEKILNHSGLNRRVKVLNLGMNSYSVPNEINSYIHLAYHLKPEIVISHSGWNDIFHMLMVPKPFKQLGLAYTHNMEDWLPRLYSLLEMRDWNAVLDENGSEFIVDSYFNSLEKYQKLVNSNDGKFIVGLQPYNQGFESKDYMATIYEKTRALYEVMLSRASGKGYIDFASMKGWEFGDSVHTVDSGSLRTAQIYATEVLKILSKDQNLSMLKRNY